MDILVPKWVTAVIQIYLDLMMRKTKTFNSTSTKLVIHFLHIYSDERHQDMELASVR